MNTVLKCVICLSAFFIVSTHSVKGQQPDFVKKPNVELAMTCGESFLFLATENGKTALLDSNRVRLTDYVYNDLNILNNEMLVAKRNGRKVLINCEGTQITSDDIIDFKVFYGDELKHRYFVINNSGKMGIIDEFGKVLVPVIYDRIDPVSAHGYFYAQGEGVKHYYRYNGKMINESGVSEDSANNDLD